MLQTGTKAFVETLSENKLFVIFIICPTYTRHISLHSPLSKLSCSHLVTCFNIGGGAGAGVAIDEKGVFFIKDSTDLGSKTFDLQKCLNTFVPDCSFIFERRGVLIRNQFFLRCEL